MGEHGPTILASDRLVAGVRKSADLRPFGPLVVLGVRLPSWGQTLRPVRRRPTASSYANRRRRRTPDRRRQAATSAGRPRTCRSVNKTRTTRIFFLRVGGGAAAQSVRGSRSHRSWVPPSPRAGLPERRNGNFKVAGSASCVPPLSPEGDASLRAGPALVAYDSPEDSRVNLELT